MRMHVQRLLVLLAVVLSGLALRPAGGMADPPAAHFRFLGPHPVAPEYGGGFCYIQYPHVHVYTPSHPALYRRHDGAYAFVGDPAPVEGYDGPRYAYHGPHPIPANVAVGEDGSPVYCYIHGPHYHAFKPIVPAGFVVKDDVYWYTGPYAPTYYVERPTYEPAINAYYEPIHYQRPVAVEPPPGYQVVPPPPPPGIYIDAPVADVVVAPPVVGVEVHTPAVWMSAGTPARVVVGGPTYVAPAPAPGVVVQGYVAAPSVAVQIGMPAVGVVVGGPPPVYVAPAPARPIFAPVVPVRPTYVEPARPVYVAPWGHVDDGKHEGWDKHEEKHEEKEEDREWKDQEKAEKHEWKEHGKGHDHD